LQGEISALNPVTVKRGLDRSPVTEGCVERTVLVESQEQKKGDAIIPQRDDLAVRLENDRTQLSRTCKGFSTVSEALIRRTV